MRPGILRWPATHRSAASSRRGDQEFFGTTGVFFDKAELQEAVVAGATLRPVDDAFTLDLVVQFGVGHWHLGICLPPSAAYFVN